MLSWKTKTEPRGQIGLGTAHETEPQELILKARSPECDGNQFPIPAIRFRTASGVGRASVRPRSWPSRSTQDPHPVGARMSGWRRTPNDFEMPQQVPKLRVLRRRHGRPRLGCQRFDAHDSHQPLHPLAIDYLSVLFIVSCLVVEADYTLAPGPIFGVTFCRKRHSLWAGTP
jgi:hypothetical protein